MSEEEKWLKLGLVSGEQVICGNCNETIKGRNDAEYGLIYLKIILPLIEVVQVLCEDCFEEREASERRG